MGTEANGEGQPNGDEVDWKAKFEEASQDAEKWKGLSRKNESDLNKTRKALDAASGASAELDAIKRAGMADAEKYAALEAQYKATTEQTGALSSENAALKTENAKMRAGLAAGLSIADIAFIPNGTEEEMIASAKTLAERLIGAETPNFDRGPRKTPEAPQGMSGFIREGFGRGPRTR